MVPGAEAAVPGTHIEMRCLMCREGRDGVKMADFTRADLIRMIAEAGRLQLIGADLAGLDMSGLTLVGADLSYADLSGTDLSGAQLSGASLWSVKARAARFAGANLSGASLGLADLAGADLRDALLERADLTGARLDGADLTDARIRGAWLDAMQRAMAIGAPPLRYPMRASPGLYIVGEDHLARPVSLRCGDRLELHLLNPTDPTAPRPAPLRIEGAQVLTARELDDADRGTVYVLAFDAVAPGHAQLVIAAGGTRGPVSLDVLVMP